MKIEITLEQQKLLVSIINASRMLGEMSEVITELKVVVSTPIKDDKK